MPRKPFELTSPRLNENDIEAQCLGLLWRRGYYPVRLNSGLFKTADNRWVRVGERGLPDYIAIHERYRGFFLEVKRPGGKLSEDQQIKIRNLRHAYHLRVAAVDSVETLHAWLNEHEV